MGRERMEYKTVLEVRSVVDRVVTGFPSVLGNVDDGGDLVEPGSYLKTLQERAGRMRWFWGHDKGQPPIATIVEIAEVGREALPAAVLARYPEATGALKVRREYLDTPRANEVLAGIRSGAINELSIGYDALQATPGGDREVAGRRVRRFLKEIRLWEMSDVNWGMNAATANVKALLAAGDTKGLAQWLEARIHLEFTEVADELFGDGYLTREERIALSAAIGGALDAFNARLAADDLAGVRERERWDKPEAPAMTPAAPPIAVEMLRRRVLVLQKELALL